MSNRSACLDVRGRAIVVGGFTPSPVSARVSALTINKIKTVQNTSVAEVLLKVATPVAIE